MDLFTDVGIDDYTSLPATYTSELATLESNATKNQNIWLWPETFTGTGPYAGITPQRIVDKLNFYYALAYTHPRIIGMLAFLYGPASPGEAIFCPARALYDVHDECFTQGVKDMDVRIGTAIITPHP